MSSLNKEFFSYRLLKKGALNEPCGICFFEVGFINGNEKLLRCSIWYSVSYFARDSAPSRR